jgi:probable HAF family extracellular repeat protein
MITSPIALRRSIGGSLTPLLLLLVLLASALVAPRAAGQVAIAMADLGIPAGGIASAALSINDQGQLTGTVYTLGRQKAVLWQNGTFVDLVPNVDYSIVGSINNSGQIAGYTYTSADLGRPFIWQNGSLTYLQKPIGSDGRAYAINDLGWAVGSMSGLALPERAALWRDGGVTMLAPAEVVSSQATDINDQGQVIGWASTSTMTAPFIWRDGTFTFGSPAHMYKAINNSGWVAGAVFFSNPMRAHATLWRAGAAIDLGVLPGDTHSVAYDVNDLGWVVGGSYRDREDEDGRPFLWRDGAMIELPFPTGGNGHAMGLNNRGQVVGVTTQDRNYIAHATLWTAAQPPVAGDVVVSELLAGSLAKIAPSGVATTFQTNIGKPGPLKFDRHGNLFVLDYAVPRVVEILQSGLAITYTTRLPEGSPVDLAIAADDTIFLLVQREAPATGEPSAEVWRVDQTSGPTLIASTAIAAPAGQSARGFTCGPGGDLYLAMQGGASGGRVMRVTRSGDVSTFFDPGWPSFGAGGGDLVDVRFNPAGDLLLLGHVPPGNTNGLWKVSGGQLSPLVSPGSISDGTLQLTIDAAGTLFASGGGFGGGYPDGAVERIDPAGTLTRLAAFPPDTPIADIDDLFFDPCPLVPPAPESVRQTATAGQAVTTDGEGDGATLADPLETTITSWVGGLISIAETANSTAAPEGYAILGYQVSIVAPLASTAAPLDLVFQLDSSRVDPSADLGQTAVFRDGSAVSDCASARAASPDPCVLSRARLADGDVRIEVLTLHASLWQLGIATNLELRGFYPPVDMSTAATRVWNTVKGGATVPLKFEAFAGAQEQVSTSLVKQPLTASRIDCVSGVEDGIEQLAPVGGTALRYDASEGQFIYNWKTPRMPGACYSVTVQLNGGSSQMAYFRLK